MRSYPVTHYAKFMIMKHEFWHERWGKKEIGFHQGEINPHLQRYWQQLNLPKGAHVFVPLCGKSRDMLWLQSRGYSVVGVEVSPVGVEAFFNENNLQATQRQSGNLTKWKCNSIEILCGDFFDLRPSDLKEITAIYDRASLVALPPEMRKQYSTHLFSVLPKDTRILLLTFEYKQEEMQGPPFAVKEEEVRALYNAHFDIEKLYEKDAMSDFPRFKERGLKDLVEKVYLLKTSKN